MAAVDVKGGDPIQVGKLLHLKTRVTHLNS